MKKLMIFLLAAVLLISTGCSKVPQETVPPTEPAPATEATAAPTEQPTEAPTEAPTEPVPQVHSGEVQVDWAPGILTFLNRGENVDVVGDFDEDYYVVKVAQGYGLMEKQLLRMAGEAAYEGWTGYAQNKAGVYTTYQLTGQPVLTLGRNTQVEVLDELEYVYVVTVEGTAGFMNKADVSKTKIKSSGGGGSADGGDISLSAGVVGLVSIQPQSGDVTGQAEVLADGSQVILGFFSRGEMAPIVAEEGFAEELEGYYTLYLDGMYAYLPRNLVRLESEAAYESWDGYAAKNAPVCDRYTVLGEGVKLPVNTVVTVLWDGGDFYLVSVDGQIGYMDADKVGSSRYSTGGGGGGDWTPPAL